MCGILQALAPYHKAQFLTVMCKHRNDWLYKRPTTALVRSCRHASLPKFMFGRNRFVYVAQGKLINALILLYRTQDDDCTRHSAL